MGCFKNVGERNGKVSEVSGGLFALFGRKRLSTR